MKKGEKFFVVFMDGQDEQFYNQYDTLVDAVTDNEDPVEVFEVTPKSLGKFEAVAQPVKLKRVK